MPAGLLEKYRSSKIRHPSWRIYKALEEVKKKLPLLKKKKIVDIKDESELSPTIFGLKEDIDVYYPYGDPDDLTNEIIACIIDPDYSDKGKFGIEECMSIFCDIENRQLLEGMLMDNALPSDISLELGYSTETILTYSSAFFDTSVWRSGSDKLAYIKQGLIGIDGSRKALITTKGIDYVATKYYNRPHKVRMERALADMFGKAYEQVIANIESDEPEDQIRAQGWAKKMIETFKELKNASKEDGGIRELSIALKTDSAPQKGIEELNTSNDKQADKEK